MKQIVEKENLDNKKNDNYYVSYILNSLMKKADMKESELCKILDMPKSTLNYLTNSKSNPRISTLIPIAKYFKISIDQLIGSVPLSSSSSVQLLSDDIIEIKFRDKEWLENLYIDCTKLVCTIINKQKIELPSIKIIQIIKEGYFYSLRKDDKIIDQNFIEWLIEKELASKE